jgi:hypothetical protein
MNDIRLIETNRLDRYVPTYLLLNFSCANEPRIGFPRIDTADVPPKQNQNTYSVSVVKRNSA